MKTLAALLVTFCLLSAASADDIYSSFSAVNNPNGNFTYGYETTLGGAFTAFTDNAALCPGTVGWQRGSGQPSVIANTSGLTTSCGSVFIPADTLNLHPGNDGSLAVVRWTAPATGNYVVEFEFSADDSTSTNAYVLLNTVILGSSAISPSHPYFSTYHFSVTAGGTLDFAVDYGQNLNFSNDSTGLHGDIIPDQVTATPEPASLALTGSGLLGFAGLVRRRLNR